MEDMRKIGFSMAVLALLAGGLGFFLRWQEVNTVFDPYTGLALRWAPVSIALMALSVVTVSILLILCFRLPKQQISSFQAAFGNTGPSGLFLALLGLGIIFLATLEALYLAESGSISVMTYLQAGSALLSGFCLAYMAMKGMKGGDIAPVASALPVAWICLWLISFHIYHASNPVLLAYTYNFFALAFLLLSLYYVASFAFSQDKSKKLLFCSSSALYFIGVTMGDAHSAYHRGLLLALAATLLIYHISLTINLARPQPAPPEESVLDHLLEPPYWDSELKQGKKFKKERKEKKTKNNEIDIDLDW